MEHEPSSSKQNLLLALMPRCVPILMRYTRKIRAQLRSGSASVFFCVTDHGDIKCSNGLTWDSAD